MFGLGKKIDDEGLFNLIATAAGTEALSSKENARPYDKNNTYTIAERFLKSQNIKLTTDQKHALQLGCWTLSGKDASVQLISVAMQNGMGIPNSAFVGVKSSLENVGLTFNTPNVHVSAQAKNHSSNHQTDMQTKTEAYQKPVMSSSHWSDDVEKKSERSHWSDDDPEYKTEKQHWSDDDMLISEKRPTKKESSEDKDFSDYFIPALVLFAIMLVIVWI